MVIIKTEIDDVLEILEGWDFVNDDFAQHRHDVLCIETIGDWHAVDHDFLLHRFSSSAEIPTAEDAHAGVVEPRHEREPCGMCRRIFTILRNLGAVAVESYVGLLSCIVIAPSVVVVIVDAASSIKHPRIGKSDEAQYASLTATASFVCFTHVPTVFCKRSI